MTIDEMIKQIKQRYKCENEKPKICMEHDCEDCENNYDESFFEHEAWKQIISWLEELKELRAEIAEMHDERQADCALKKEHDEQIRVDAIEECLKIVEFHSNEYDGICWAIRDLKELKERE